MKKTNYSIFDILFYLSIFSMVTMNYSFLGKVLQLSFTIYAVIMVVLRTKKIHLFHILELLFAIYILFQCLFGIAAMPKGTLSNFVTVLYCSLYSLGIYNYLSYKNDFEEVLKKYANASMIGLVLLIILYFKSVLNFRLSANTGINILGMVLFKSGSSTALSMMAMSPAFFVTMFLYNDNLKKKKLYLVFFVIASFITGTRKTLIFIPLIIIVYILKFNSVNLKRGKYIVGFSIIAVLGCVLLMKAPIFYKFVGYRVESAIESFTSSDTDDSSIIVRRRLIKRAVELYKEKPILGWGMDYFKSSGQSDLGYYTHNNFLEILSGGGIVGFIIYYSKYVLLLSLLLKKKLRNKYDLITIRSCIVFLLLMVFIEYWQIVYIYRYIEIYLVMLLYIASSDEVINKKEKNADEKKEINT